jgi:nucleoside-diphosphate-sugar epimerase
MSGETVLVTGGSGFVGAHCIVRLLQSGYRVRTTLRSLARADEVRKLVRAGGVEPGDQLSFAQADLMSDAGWAEAVAGCDYVLHVASPFPGLQPKDENELIRPAREGTLRVLAAARDAGVRRVVLTSSFAAIGYGHQERSAPFDEHEWTDVDASGVAAYAKSKTLAERAAWDFVAREGGALELAVVNPVAVFGPTLGRDISTSIDIIRLMLNRAMPAVPRIMFGVVDVRDVADLHLLAMTNPQAKGERFLAVAGDFVSFAEIGRILRRGLGDGPGEPGRRVPTAVMPDWLLRAAALFVPAARMSVPELNKTKNATAQKARRVLGWQPRSVEEALVASARSLIALGLVKE